VRNAVSLCGSLFANVFRFDGEFLHFVAGHNVGPSYVELLRAKYPMRPDFSQVSAHAKANPGKISMASGGIGTPGHVAGELFKMMAGVDMVHVPYRGGGAVVSDLLGGQVQVLSGTTSLTAEQLRKGGVFGDCAPREQVATHTPLGGFTEIARIESGVRHKIFGSCDLVLSAAA
jgi:Tripartite tricarboxylate transporter family receptor